MTRNVKVGNLVNNTEEIKQEEPVYNEVVNTVNEPPHDPPAQEAIEDDEQQPLPPIKPKKLRVVRKNHVTIKRS